MIIDNQKCPTTPSYKQNISINDKCIIPTGYHNPNYPNRDTHRKIVFHHVSQVAFCFASLKLACSLDEQCFMLEHKSAAL